MQNIHEVLEILIDNNTKERVKKLFESLESECKIIAICENEVELVHNIKPKILGKSGVIPELLSLIKDLSIEEKKVYSSTINAIKNEIQTEYDNKLSEIQRNSALQKLEKESIDPTIPAKCKISNSSLHVITKSAVDLIKILENMGFSIYNSPEIDTNENNFTKLNIPEHHPARQMHDTFYICDQNGERNEEYIMRTHTSNTQILALSNNKPPIRGISFGKVFRFDSDATHSPMFHQMECFCVDKNINMANLKATVQQMVNKFFETEVDIRLRPSFFPFTQPSAEIDISYIKHANSIKIGKSNQYLEIGGLGMIHDNVLRNCGIDPEEYQGFAFGFGVDRMAMLKYGLNDIRKFYNPDENWIKNNNISHIFT